jgi:hypothetical protein
MNSPSRDRRVAVVELAPDNPEEVGRQYPILMSRLLGDRDFLADLREKHRVMSMDVYRLEGGEASWGEEVYSMCLANYMGNREIITSDCLFIRPVKITDDLSYEEFCRMFKDELLNDAELGEEMPDFVFLHVSRQQFVAVNGFSEHEISELETACKIFGREADNESGG